LEILKTIHGLAYLKLCLKLKAFFFKIYAEKYSDGSTQPEEHVSEKVYDLSVEIKNWDLNKS